MSDMVKEKKIYTLQCEKHGEYTGEGYTLNFPGMGLKEFSPMCSECEKEAELEKQAKQEELEKRYELQRIKEMNIEPRFYEATLDNFDAYNPELKKNLEACRAFMEKPDGKIVMLGENGNGKTHLAIGILKELGGVIYTAYEIGVKLRQSYNGETKEWEVFDELCTVPLLVIDEVEKIKDSESKQNWVSYVVGKRYDRMLPIVFIGNCHTKKDCKEPQPPCKRCLEYHLENDVLSRIIEDGVILKFGSDDYRRKIRNVKGVNNV